MPTILLSNHPGHAHAAGVRTPVDRLEAMLDALDDNGWLAEVDAVLTGYLPSPEHVGFAERAIARAKRRRPAATIIVDPVLGDEPKGLYVDPAAAATIRDQLLPMADVTTPNRFELGWLSGRSIADPEDAEAAAHALGRPSVIVSSAAVLKSANGLVDRILTLLVSAGAAARFATPHHPTVPHGTGDLLSALLIGHLLSGRGIDGAVARSVAGVACAIDGSAGLDELAFAGILPAIAGAAPWPPGTAAQSGWVAGVDGCPAGWLAVLRPIDDPAASRALILPRFADVLTLPEMPCVIAVDMPIGLPERSGIGGRRCDVEARANLGQRQSAVFAVPSRAAVMTEDYRRACEVAATTSEPSRKVSKQAFNLFPKIRELDALLSPALQSRVREVHPELAFWAMNGEQPLSEPKKVKSRANAEGLTQRRALLAGAGYDLDRLEAFRPAGRDAGPDDLLDAAACSWTAARIMRGTARRFPADPPVDSRGLAMEIWG